MFSLKIKMLWIKKRGEIKKACQNLLHDKAEIHLKKSSDNFFHAKIGVTYQATDEMPQGFSKSYPLGEKELWISSGSQGRFNRERLKYPYLGFDELTAVAEVRPMPWSQITIGVYTLLKDLRVIDARRVVPANFFTIDSREFISSLSASPHIEGSLIYEACNLCADIFKEEGYEGMIWNSAQRHNGRCLVIFTDNKQRLFERVKEIFNTVEIYSGQVIPCTKECSRCISNFDFARHIG